jgi:hypothetical protein
VQFKKRKTGHALMGTTAPVANSTIIKVESVAGASVAPPPPPLPSDTDTLTSNEALFNTVTSSAPAKEVKEAAVTAAALVPAASTTGGGGGFKMKIGNMSNGGAKRQFRVRPPSP